MGVEVVKSGNGVSNKSDNGVGKVKSNGIDGKKSLSCGKSLARY